MLHRLNWKWLVADATAWIVAGAIACFLRFDFTLPSRPLSIYLAIGALGAALQVVVGLGFGVYLGRYRIGSFDDLRNEVRTAAVTAAALIILVFLAAPPDAPRSAPFVIAVFASAISFFGHATARELRERSYSYGTKDVPVILFGAGGAGEQLARSMRHSPGTRFRPVAFLDDNPGKRPRHLEGVRVHGDRTALATTAHKTRAKALIVSIANVDALTINEMTTECIRFGLKIYVLPSPGDLVGGTVSVGDIREVDEEDLMGRHVVDIDTSAIAKFLAGQRVLVTGAGGSIGSELARQIHQYGPAELMLMDHDETNLQTVQLSIHGHRLVELDQLLLADIRDADRLNELFQARQPDIVFHAAALKHLPFLEGAPREAIKSNVIGTQNALNAAAAVGVSVFVNISTDKAADPVSVLGFSKRITERLTAGFGHKHPGNYLSVRFGNVLGSRGSVLGTFREQINRGGPVTVTHPDVTRFFMTISEAVLLVLQAAVEGQNEEVLILDMGEPVRIADVAHNLVRASGKPIEIVYSGLRLGEKLDEVLLAENEVGTNPGHPLITHVKTTSLDNSQLNIDTDSSDAAASATLARLCREPTKDLAARIPTQAPGGGSVQTPVGESG